MESPVRQETHGKLSAVREERESERSKYPRRRLENAEAMEKWARAD